MLQNRRTDIPKIYKNRTANLKMNTGNQAFFVFLKRKMSKAYLCCLNFDKFLTNHTFLI